MHKNDSEPRTIFGKTYIWVEGEGGRLSLQNFERVLATFREAIAQVEASHG